MQGFNNRKVKFRKIIVSDVNTDAVEKLRVEFPFIQTDSASVAASQDIIFLSMQANVIMDTLALLKDDFDRDSIIVSLAPDITFNKISLRLPELNKFAIALPSVTSYINEGYIPVSFAPGFPESDKDDVLDLFGHLGKAIVVAENRLENFAMLSAMLPAYFLNQWKELISMGHEIGLTENECLDIINESVAAALHMTYRSGIPPEQIMNLIPVKPLEEEEEDAGKFYRSTLRSLYRQIKPEVFEGVGR